MRADLYTLQERFSNSFFKIPKFQRGYAWEIDEWQEFWRTIGERALDIDTSNIRHSPVFMGAIVLQEQSPEVIGSSEFKIYHIIDGQQRFVTVSVFLAVVRDFYFGVGGTHYSTWTKEFLKVSLNLMNTEFRIRLTLQDADHEVFELITGDKTEEQWKAIKKGNHSLEKLYKFFWEKLSLGKEEVLEELTIEDEDLEEIENDNEDVILERINERPFLDYLPRQTDRDWTSNGCFDPVTLTNIIIEHMKFAVIEIQEQDNEIAFEVFEVLNAQGQPLEEVDKFRNGFFMLDPENSDSNFHTYWQKMEEAVGNIELLSTFFNEETIRRFGLTPKDKTYQRLMTNIKAKTSAPNVRSNKSLKKEIVVNEFKSLKVALRAFLIAHKGIDPLVGQTNEGLQYGLHLNFLRNIVTGPATPLLMDILIWTDSKRTDREIQIQVNDILQSIETLLVRRLLGGVKPQQLRSLMAGLPKKINEEIRVIDSSMACTVENLKHYNRILNNTMIGWQPERFPTDASLLGNPLRDVYQTTGRKYSLFTVLFDLERSLNREYSSQKIPSQFGKGNGAWSIEHVLPQGQKLDNNDVLVMNQNWKSEWQTLKVAEPESEFLKCVHSIGNLTIVINRTNSSLGNKVFLQKKEIYKEHSRIFLTDDIKSSVQWTPENIEQRAIDLLNKVILRWPYPVYQD
jgi:uncharacterized protein with ParB-like and HNH nuclease domain